MTGWLRRRGRVVAVVGIVVVLAVGSWRLATPRSYDSSWRQIGQATFSGGVVGKKWDIYNEPRAPDPVANREASKVDTKANLLDIHTAGQEGGGMCWCNYRPTSLYGRWEIRARMSPGIDHGPALLLFPTSGHWPIGGEIDIAEMFNPQRLAVTSTIHYSSTNRTLAHTTRGDFTRWHTYAVSWEPNSITFWVDGVKTYTTTDGAAIPHDPMFLALQAGPLVRKATPNSADLQIGWVKVFAA